MYNVINLIYIYILKIKFLENNRLFEVIIVYGNNEKMRGKYDVFSQLEK